MSFSILHISDLHQDFHDEIPAEWLVDSIEKDIHKLIQDDPSFPLPTVCIVSGDIIYGAPPGHADPEGELRRQYNLAQEFLEGLCVRLFAGKRANVIIVPGNHDVAYNRVLASGSTIPIPANQQSKKSLVSELHSANSAMRWKWSSLEFFRITKKDVYLSRFEYFSEMYAKFYNGERHYNIDPSSQYDVFDFPDLEFTVLGLNSCHNNDPMRRRAAIHPTAVTRGARAITMPERTGWLSAAVWHHDVQGRDFHDDFLDPGFLQILIESGVAIGFHGHQHRSDCFDQKNRLGQEPRKISVISAGTLCADAAHLSPGQPRGYNLVKIDKANLQGRVHQRRMINDTSNLPIWGPGNFVDSGKSYMDFDMSAPRQPRPPAMNKALQVEKLSDLLGRRKWTEAVELGHSLRDDATGNTLFLQALEQLADPKKTIELLGSPKTDSEAAILGTAILEIRDLEKMATFLSLPVVAASKDPSVREISMRMNRAMK